MPTLCSPKLIQELLLSLASGRLPHESVARVHKCEGIMLGFVVNAKHKEMANFDGRKSEVRRTCIEDMGLSFKMSTRND